MSANHKNNLDDVSKGAARIPLKTVNNMVNNTLTKDIWAQMPQGRTRISINGEDDSCPILKNNNTLTLLMPGWEGIPTNFLINSVLVAVSLILKCIFVAKNELSSDPFVWLLSNYPKNSQN